MSKVTLLIDRNVCTCGFPERLLFNFLGLSSPQNSPSDSRPEVEKVRREDIGNKKSSENASSG